MTWINALSKRRYRWAIAFCAGTLAMMVFYMPTFYQDIIRPKESILLYDPVLSILTPIDWSIPIFALIYISAIQTVFSCILKPAIFIPGLTTYCVVSIVRMCTIYLVTLEPPTDMILLIDPVTTFLVYPDSGFAKDLFFSGHVSTMAVMVLTEENKVAKTLKISATALVGIMLAWQHVHYTVDLVVAPFVTWIIYAGLLKMMRPPVGPFTNGLS